MSGTMTIQQITAVIERKREQHAELAAALTWPGFLRICERERIVVRKSRGPMPRPAQLIPFAGGWTILLGRSQPERRHTYLGVHELGHLWCHHDATSDRWERVYNMDTYWADDPREDDAELFAALVLMGPRSARPFTGLAETKVQFALRTMRVPRKLE